MDSNQVIRIEVGCSLTMCSGTGGMLEDRTIVELKIQGYCSLCSHSITANTQWDLMEKEQRLLRKFSLSELFNLHSRHSK